jgi:hypothetical protein
MLVLGFSLPKSPVTTTAPDRTKPVVAALTASTLAPAPYTERHNDGNVVDGLGHYIDSRLGEERFRID